MGLQIYPPDFKLEGTSSAAWLVCRGRKNQGSGAVCGHYTDKVVGTGDCCFQTGTPPSQRGYRHVEPTAPGPLDEFKELCCGYLASIAEMVL